MNVGWGELLVLLAIGLLLFGGRKLPAVGRSLGEAIREFQRALRGKSDDQHPPPTEKP